MSRALHILFLLVCFTSWSQQNTASDIQVPGNPSLAIIGLQSAEISKPGNYTGLFSSLLAPIVSNGGNLPTDLAFEFSPFYLKSRDITDNELLGINPYRDLKVSIASTSVAAIDGTAFSRLGMGFKTNFLSGKITVKSTDDLNVTRVSTANDVNQVFIIITRMNQEKLDTITPSAITDRIDELNPDLKKEIAQLITEFKSDKNLLIAKIQELKTSVEKSIVIDDSKWNYSLRTGNFLELAGAFAIDFRRNTLNSGNIDRWGLWLNYTYRPTKNLGIFDISALARISNYSFGPDIIFEKKPVFADFGASINLRIPGGSFLFSGEWIGKFGLAEGSVILDSQVSTFRKSTEHKWNITGGYVITPNLIWSVSLTDVTSEASYFKTNNVQMLMGLSASLVPLKN